ncbi:MAG: hypothetical protein ACP5GW_06025, partial [Caldisericaceae bacterium]
KSYGMQEDDIPMVSKYILERSEKMYAMSLFNPVKANVDNMNEFFYTAYEGRDYLEKVLAKRQW